MRCVARTKDSVSGRSIREKDESLVASQETAAGDCDNETKKLVCILSRVSGEHPRDVGWERCAFFFQDNTQTNPTFESSSQGWGGLRRTFGCPGAGVTKPAAPKGLLES